MFQKRIIEFFTFVLYWLVFMPYAHEYAKERQWLSLDLNQFSEVVKKYAVFIVGMIVVYIAIYRIILFIYMKCKICDINMFNNLKQMHIDPEKALSRDNLSKSTTTLDQMYQAVSTVDEVDSNRSMRKIHSAPTTPNYQRRPRLPISSPLPQRGLLARTNIGFVAETLPAVHNTIRPMNVNTSEYCIRKPAPPPPPATPQAARKAICMNPRPDLLNNAHSKFTPATPIYGTRKQFVLPPLPK